MSICSNCKKDFNEYKNSTCPGCGTPLEKKDYAERFEIIQYLGNQIHAGYAYKDKKTDRVYLAMFHGGIIEVNEEVL